MIARFKHHEDDGLNDVVFEKHPHLYRKNDVVILRKRYYVIEECQYDIDEDEATYWLDQARSGHPTAPLSDT